MKLLKRCAPGLAALVLHASTSAARADPPAVAAEPALKKFELPYVAQEGRARRVIVQVTLNDRVTALLALDTGSPGLVLSSALAERLDIFSRDQGKLVITAGGIGGAAPAVRSIIESVAVGGAVEKFVPVTITAKISDLFEGLVGMDFMSRYAMTIDSARKLVVLQELPAPGDAPGGHSETWWRDTFAEFRAQRDGWRQYRESLDRELGESQMSAGAPLDALKERRRLANLQAEEAEKLFSRLERYASSQSVPRHWR